MPSSVRLAFHHWRQPQTLNLPNRRVRTRMPGGVGGGSCKASPYPDKISPRLTGQGQSETDIPQDRFARIECQSKCQLVEFS
jgi:hypothetical protein